jgi:2,4-dienoyl-CoA reductase (NADPH2)
VSIVSRSERFGRGIGPTSRWVAVGRLRQAGVRFVSDAQYQRIRPGALEVEADGGVLVSIPADTVIVCAGQESRGDLAVELDVAGIAHTVIGGALDARAVDAVRATSEGLAASRLVSP